MSKTLVSKELHIKDMYMCRDGKSYWTLPSLLPNCGGEGCRLIVYANGHSSYYSRIFEVILNKIFYIINRKIKLSLSNTNFKIGRQEGRNQFNQKPRLIGLLWSNDKLIWASWKPRHTGKNRKYIFRG